MEKDITHKELLHVIKELRARLEEAEETLRAIRSGEVDALVVSGEHGDQVFTLKGAEQPYRTLIEIMKEGAVTLASDNTILYCNSSFARMLKTPLEKITGSEIVDYIAPIDQAAFEEMLRDRSGEGEIVLVAGDGTAMPVWLSVNASEINNVSYLVAVDLTAYKHAEEQIRKQASLLDKAQDAIIVRDLEHRIIYWNKSAERIYGWRHEEVRGKNADELLHKEEPPQLIVARKSIIEKGEWMSELRQRTKEGREIIVESRWTLVRDSEGRPESILMINTDITEKTMMESQLMRIQRMESMGLLAGGIAHDINNLLTPITMSLSLLKLKFSDEKDVKLIETLERNAKRGTDLVKQILLFSRGVQGERRAIKISNLISDVGKILMETIPKNIEIKTDTPPDLWDVTGDYTQLHQVLINLCLNACDAMHKGGVLSISANNAAVDEYLARTHPGAHIGRYVVITVSDTGTGIPPEIQERIFDPFFTTKDHGKGTGLGLSIAFSIVKSHGGFLNVYSEMEKGTTFKVFIPVGEAAISRNEVKAVKRVSNNERGGLILVIDDEADIIALTKAILEAKGYSVISAENGAAGLNLYKQRHKEVNAVIIDMMMPVMDGPACIKEMRRIDPNVKVIGVTGLSDAIPRTLNIAFLQKPYTTEVLMDVIKNVLEDNTGNSEN